jgi:hypothetical protein
MWLKNHDPTVGVFSHEVDATCLAQNKQLTFRSEMSMIDVHLSLTQTAGLTVLSEQP